MAFWEPHLFHTEPHRQHFNHVWVSCLSTCYLLITKSQSMEPLMVWLRLHHITASIFPPSGFLRSPHRRLLQIPRAHSNPEIERGVLTQSPEQPISEFCIHNLHQPLRERLSLHQPFNCFFTLKGVLNCFCTLLQLTPEHKYKPNSTLLWPLTRW